MRHELGILKNPITYFMLVILTLLPLSLAIWEQLDTIEGNAFPVIESVSLNSFIKTPAGYLTSWTFYKKRGCDFDSIAFYEGDRKTGFSRIPLSFIDLGSDPSNPQTQQDESDRTRAIGWNHARNWLLRTQTPPISESLEDGVIVEQINWFANVRHVCHPLWKTQTRFFN